MSTTRIRRIAPSNRATGGLCAICDAHATTWHRTGLAAGGLTVAGRACADHEQEVVSGLVRLTAEDLARLTPRHRRAARAASALRRADRLDGYARGWRRHSAGLQGASSLTHTCAIAGAVCGRESGALRDLAAALTAALTA